MLAKQFKLSNGQYWEAVSDENTHTLIRKDGGYEQYGEQHDTEAELIESMEEIAPLSEWEEYEG